MGAADDAVRPFKVLRDKTAEIAAKHGLKLHAWGVAPDEGDGPAKAHMLLVPDDDFQRPDNADDETLKAILRATADAEQNRRADEARTRLTELINEDNLKDPRRGIFGDDV